MTTKVISICNLKGGTGKTTTALNLGAALARSGKRTLLIDLDPQGNLTESLGQEAQAIQNDIINSLSKQEPPKPLVIEENLWLVPTTLELASAESKLAEEAVAGGYPLQDVIEPIKSNFDYILIDCSPSIGATVINALVASDSLIVPMQAEYLPLTGLKKLTDLITKVQRRLNPKMRVSGILVTQYDQRKVLGRQIVETVQEHFRAEIFDTKIRTNVALAESPSRGLDIFRYSPESNGAEDYAALCTEVLARHE